MAPSYAPEGLAGALAEAWREGRALDVAPWQAGVPDAAVAYAVQAALADAQGWGGTDVPLHWKSGGPSRTAVLTHAPLPPAGVRASPARYGDMRFHQPGIEAEIALCLGTQVSPEDAAALTPEAALGLVDAMTVSIEIVDSRWTEGQAAPALLRLADLQSHGALVIGPWMAWQPRDWAAQRCEVRIGGREAAVFTGTHSMGDPAWLLPTWLRHATRDGATVPARTVVTTGTWCGVLPIAAGETVVVDFPGIGRAEATL